MSGKFFALGLSLILVGIAAIFIPEVLLYMTAFIFIAMGVGICYVARMMRKAKKMGSSLTFKPMLIIEDEIQEEDDKDWPPLDYSQLH